MVELDECLKKEKDYVKIRNGFSEIREADETFNDINRIQIDAFCKHYGKAFLAKINYHGEERKAVSAGTKEVYTEYNGQSISNFQFDFCVPEKDERLAMLIRKWNREGENKKLDDVDAIYNRIKYLEGIYFLWF